MARHIEHPGSRHSKPASTNILSRPSCSACSLTRPEPGTTMACLTDEATRLPRATTAAARTRSEEHTSELQPLMRISYAVFCLKKKNTNRITTKLKHAHKNN